jgi:hypothetical protein
MEVLLNTIWLLVAISAFVYWRFEEDAGAATVRHHRGLAIMVLGCALLLLFPVISLTDDLHSEQFPVEDSLRSAMKARSLEHGCLCARRFPFPVLAHPANSIDFGSKVLGAVMPPQIRPLYSSQVSPQKGRSPPFNA